MQTTREKIEVMQAFERGEKIEVRSRFWPDDEWCIIPNPVWNWDDLEYRVAPKPKEKKYRPYESIEEMVEDYDKRFARNARPDNTMPLIWVYRKENDDTALITLYGQKDFVCAGFEWNSLVSMFDKFTYLDGTPFGKESY